MRCWCISIRIRGRLFTRQLFRILPPPRRGEVRRGRMLITCRTHYFRTLRDQQTHLTAEDRDSVRKEDYRAPFVLLPFTESQIREYVKHTLPDEDTDRATETLDSVHNLREMAARPYTLSLIAEQFAQIERWKAEGRRVTGLMLYRHMVLSWLERDTGKHQLTPDHKQALMEHFAAELWRAGERFWSVGELEQWLIDFLRARPELAAHYTEKTRDQLKEDLRTATFLVRDGEDKFRFAHTSLQEYFLAGYLRRGLVEGRPETWEMPKVSPETLDFLGQWLDGEDGKRQALALGTLGRLRDGVSGAGECAGVWVFSDGGEEGVSGLFGSGVSASGGGLTEWEVKGSEGAPLMLAGMDLRGARLWNSCWRWCNLEGTVFEGVDGFRAEWLDCRLGGTKWGGAKLAGVVFRECGLAGAGFVGAECERAQFLWCAPEERVAGGLCSGRRDAGSGGFPAFGWRAGITSWVRGCAWSPDGRRIVSASDDSYAADLGR